MSIDSKFCHKAWAASFDGITFPLLADFHPKGEVSKAFGIWLDGPGIGDRATILIGKDGNVLWSEAVGPPAERNIGDLLAKCQELG
ncbi:MAG: alkyl hydroperoxide reductase subunit AhpC [Planctomycetota bacterium]|jgi:alkyl hydroperoxide reductase subunit AhpC